MMNLGIGRQTSSTQPSKKVTQCMQNNFATGLPTKTRGGQKERISALDDDELVRRRNELRTLLSPMEFRGSLHQDTLDQVP